MNNVGIRRKRGRPPNELRAIMRKAGESRNLADMTTAYLRGIAPDLRKELVGKCRAGECRFSPTLLAVVARFPHDQQREALQKLDAMGVRAAKRYVENKLRPPTPSSIALAVAAFLEREFSAVDAYTLREGLNEVYCALYEA